MAKDLTVQLPDRPGTLADLGEALGGAGINIAGAAGMAAGGQADIHLLVHDPAAARGAIEQAGFQVTNERDVVVADIADEPGALGKAARRMASTSRSFT